jgi:hypothetical protein
MDPPSQVKPPCASCGWRREAVFSELMRVGKAKFLAKIT